MADSKITALTSISTSTDPANDPLVIVDVSDTSMAATGTTKKVTLNQLLGASGTATLASATITGDLTVDTNTLYVNSSTNRVGIGTASPSGIFHAANLGTDGTTADNFNGYFSSANRNCSIYLLAKNTEGSNFYFGDGDNNTIGGIIYDHTSNYMRFDVNGSEQMRLNSTGLGVGAVPSNYRLYVSAAFASGLNGAYIECGEFNKKSLIVNHTNASVSANLFEVQKTGTAQFLVDSSGNVGIGVTPSAWTLKSLQIVAGGIYGSGNETGYYANAFYGSSGWRYINAAGASGYLQNGGSHQWYRSTSSNVAGTDPVFDQAMTLDASGNLLVGTTSGSYRGQFAVASGADRNIFTAQVTGASNGFQVMWNHATTTLRINVSNLPTSSAGLPVGTLWIDTAAGNTLKVA